MNPQIASLAMLAVMITTSFGLLSLFVYWLLNARPDMEGPKHTLLEHEQDAEGEEIDREVFV